MEGNDASRTTAASVTASRESTMAVSESGKAALRRSSRSDPKTSRDCSSTARSRLTPNDRMATSAATPSAIADT